MKIKNPNMVVAGKKAALTRKKNKDRQKMKFTKKMEKENSLLNGGVGPTTRDEIDLECIYYGMSGDYNANESLAYHEHIEEKYKCGIPANRHYFIVGREMIIEKADSIIDILTAGIKNHIFKL